MENLELYRKYRPSSFDEVVGNETTIKTIKKELENGSHTFLLTGNAGCGKTTLARIMAKELGAGEMSINEINSAENRGIDTAREVMEQMRYSPSDGSSLVWIFDECHQWLAPVQNAFLKALEDTPSHCYFFLCTTDPQKLIAPLKSRCSIIKVSSLNENEMVYLLKRTARSEKIKVSEKVLERIVDIADGGARTALKLLSKVLFLDNDEERLEALKNVQDNDSPQIIELCKALLQPQVKWQTLSKILKNGNFSDAERCRQSVIGYMNSVLLNGKISPQVVSAIQAFSSADTYKNGKIALTVACLDYLDLLEE